MRLALATILIATLTASAWACPAPPPGEDFHCSKYDHMYQNLVPQPVVVQVYVRDERGTIPRRAKNVMKYLTKSTWHARADQGVDEALQLFDAANVPDTYELTEGAQQIFIRALDKVDHQFHVTMDSGTFKVMRCKEGKHTRTCLVRE